MSPMAFFSAITVVVTSIVAAVIEPHTPTDEGVIATPYVEEAAVAPRTRPSAITMAIEHHERITNEVVKPLQERPRMEAMSRIALPRVYDVSYALLERTDKTSVWMPFEVREDVTEGRYLGVPKEALSKNGERRVREPQIRHVHLALGRLHLETGEIQLRLRGEAEDAWIAPKAAVARMRMLR